jgi:hypothetical protein
MIMEAEAAGYADKVTVGLTASSGIQGQGRNEYDLDFKTVGPDKNPDLP